MDGYISYINRHVQRYDRELFAERNKERIVLIKRRNFRWVPYEFEGATYCNLVPSPQFIFALTNNWRANGSPVEYGAEWVLSKLKGQDLWEDKDLIAKLDAENDKVDERKRRDFKNKTEDYLYDRHSQIKKAWSDINTSSLSKIEKRRIRNEYRK